MLAYFLPGGSREGVGLSQSVQVWRVISACSVAAPYDGRLHQLTPSCIRCRCVPVSVLVIHPYWYLNQVGQQAARYRRHIMYVCEWFYVRKVHQPIRHCVLINSHFILLKVNHHSEAICF